MAICKIAFKDIKKIDFIVTKGMTASQVYEKYKPDYMINGALYDMRSKVDITKCEDENEKYGYLFSNEGIGINGQKQMIWCEAKLAYDSKNIRDYISGSPTLVKNGKQFIQWGNKVSRQVTGKHTRSCIGFSKDFIYLLSTPSLLTVEKLAAECIKQGMEYAINLDGGGSCHLQQGTKKLMSSSRANCSWILVYLNKEKKEDDHVEAVKVKCNGKEQTGFIKDGVTYVPVRFVGENLGASVEWNGQTKTVTVEPKKGV